MNDVFLSSLAGTLVNLTVKMLGKCSTRGDSEDHGHKQGSAQVGIPPPLKTALWIIHFERIVPNTSILMRKSSPSLLDDVNK